jgi:hypothetical protein
VPDPQPGRLRTLRETHAPRVLKKIKGMGTVYDWRGTGLLPPNGGRITPLIAVEHIPVYPNKPGYQDFVGLAAVLRAQGLSLQAATDRDGNVALYNPFDVLCYQARGANQVSFGVEHMHMTVDEDWTRRQLRASAWIWQLAERKHGIPCQMADLDDGPGTVRVRRRGHTSHKNVSARAGYHDRSDPGPKYDWGYVKHCADFYVAHGHMEGA